MKVARLHKIEAVPLRPSSHCSVEWVNICPKNLSLSTIHSFLHKTFLLPSNDYLNIGDFFLYPSLQCSKLEAARFFLSSCLLEHNMNGDLQKMTLSKRAETNTSVL